MHSAFWNFKGPIFLCVHIPLSLRRKQKFVPPLLNVYMVFAFILLADEFDGFPTWAQTVSSIAINLLIAVIWTFDENCFLPSQPDK